MRDSSRTKNKKSRIKLTGVEEVSETDLVKSGVEGVRGEWRGNSRVTTSGKYHN